MVSSRNLKSGDEDFKVRQRMGPVFTDNLCTFIITANTNKYNLYNSDNLWQFSAVGWFGGVPLQKGGGQSFNPDDRTSTEVLFQTTKQHVTS